MASNLLGAWPDSAIGRADSFFRENRQRVDPEMESSGSVTGISGPVSAGTDQMESGLGIVESENGPVQIFHLASSLNTAGTGRALRSGVRASPLLLYGI